MISWSSYNGISELFLILFPLRTVPGTVVWYCMMYSRRQKPKAESEIQHSIATFGMFNTLFVVKPDVLGMVNSYIENTIFYFAVAMQFISLLLPVQ